ncbi:MAG: methyltransferase domain-containing protein [Acidimicrobiales bacterium]
MTYSDTVDHLATSEPTPRLQWARDLAEPITGRRIVDVGCWTGGLLKLFVPMEPAELMGIDIAGPWIQAAGENIPSAHFLEVATLSDLPPSLAHHFDVVTLLETLEHLPRGSETSAIRALAGLLAPGGRLIFSTPAAGIASILDPAWILTGHRHYRLTTLTEIFSSAGLEVHKVHYSGNFWTSLDTFLLYFFKHVLHRGYRSYTFISSRQPTHVYPRRRPTSNIVWLEARVNDHS